MALFIRESAKLLRNKIMLSISTGDLFFFFAKSQKNLRASLTPMLNFYALSLGPEFYVFTIKSAREPKLLSSLLRIVRSWVPTG